MIKDTKEIMEPGRDLIIGRNAVNEALRSGRPVDSLLVAKGARSGSLVGLVARAREQGIVIKEVDERRLDAMCGGAVHQGVAAMAAVREYADLEDLFALAQERGEPPFFLVADGLEDPHNLGAVLRTAECAGAHGVIIPRRRSAGLGATVGKASAGAVEYVPVARVNNIAATLDELKKRGVWVYGAHMEGVPWCECDLSGPVALVVGGEGAGLGRLVREKCDALVSLPMRGQVNSLNASVAAGILMYEVTRRRLGLGVK